MVDDRHVPRLLIRLAWLELALQLLLYRADRMGRYAALVRQRGDKILPMEAALVSFVAPSLNPFHQRIVYERVEDVHETVLVVPQQTERHFAAYTEDTYRLPLGGLADTADGCSLTFDSGHTKGTNEVPRQPEGHDLRRFQQLPL